jgi:hypothetical protein
VARATDGGRLAASARLGEDGPQVAVEYAAAADDLDLRYDTEVAAAAARSMGGSLEITRDGGQERVIVRLPSGSQP